MRERTVNTQRTRKAVHWDLPVELRRQRASSLPDETEAGQRHVRLYLQGLLSPLPGKNAEDIATFVDVERQVIQDFIGTVPWDHRPLVTVLVGQVAARLGEPD